MQQLLACLFRINIEFIDENNKINLIKKKTEKFKILFKYSFLRTAKWIFICWQNENLFAQ